MNTSSFTKYHGENSVSIVNDPPADFKGRIYAPLVPPQWLLEQYKTDNNKRYFVEGYITYVLEKLDAHKVYSDLGKHAVLLTHDEPNILSHRHTVAAWLEKELGIRVREYKESRIRKLLNKLK